MLTTWVRRATRPQAKSPAQLYIDLTASVTDYVGQFLFARVEDQVLSDVGLEAPVGFVAHGAWVRGAFIARACGLCCDACVGLTYADRCCMPQMVSLCSRSEPSVWMRTRQTRWPVAAACWRGYPTTITCG